MKNTAIVSLVVLNALLLAAFLSGGAVTSTSSTSGMAFAQVRGGQRPGDYLMIPGEVTGGSTSVVYIIDTTNGWLGAFAYDDAVKRVEAMPNKIDLAQVFTQGGGNAPPLQNEPANPRDKKPADRKGY